MRIETITCDACGEVKKETNHWFKMVMYEDGRLMIAPASVSLNVVINGFSGEKKVNRGLLDLCGEACVLKEVSKVLGSNK